MVLNHSGQASAGKLCGLRLLVAALVLLPAFCCASAAVTASITVSGSVQGTDTSSIVIAFNGFTETVHYDSTSTRNSVASAFAAMLSRDYTKAGLCASASGNVISIQLKTGAFTPISITNSNTSFQLAPSGFLAMGSQPGVPTVALR